MATETRVRVSIEADKTTGAIQATGEELKKFGDQAKAAGESAKKGAEGAGIMGEATDALSGQLQALVGGAAIAAFFKGAVEASLEESEALRQVKFAVESTGQSWGAYKDKVDAFAASQQAATQFDDGVTIQVLGKLTRATGDVESAMRATALAQDIAAATGKDLSETTRTVSDLLTGQERGLAMARKEFGAYVGEATNGQEALDSLSKAFEGAAASQDGAAKSIAQAQNAFGEFQQQVGDGVMPIFLGLLKVIAMVVKGWEELGAAAAGAMAGIVVGAEGAGEAMRAAFSGNFTEAVRIARQTKDQLALVAEETAQNVQAIEDRYTAQRVEKVVTNADLVAKARAAEEEKASEQAVQARIDMETKLVDATHQLIETDTDYKRRKLAEEVEAARQAGVDKAVIEDYRLEKTKQIDKQEVALKKKSTEEIKRMEQEKLLFIGSTLGKLSVLSQSKTKELAMIGRAGGVAEALISAHVGAAKAVSRVEMFPFNFVLAGIIEAAGIAQAASIAGIQLEKGGVVPGSTAGTSATIGEKGKAEAVIPLEDPRAMKMVGEAISKAGGAGGTAGGIGEGVTVVNNFNNTFNLPGGSALQEPEVVREILETIAEQMERGTPEAIRAALNITRSAERNAGRAS